MDLVGKEQPRYIDFSDEAKKDIETLSDQVPRFKTVFKAAYTFLKDYAHLCKCVSPPNFYLYKTGATYKIPAFEFLFSMDDKNIRIHNIWQATLEEDLDE